jgi:hypothetical protein
MRAFPIAMLAAALSACASGTFRISPAEQLKAEQYANLVNMAQTGLEGTWLTHDWQGGLCHWSKANPEIAVCHTATRMHPQYPWSAGDERYRRDSVGEWQLLPRS